MNLLLHSILKYIVIISDQNEVCLKDVQQYKDSDQWLHEEVSATLLICSPLLERQKK